MDRTPLYDMAHAAGALFAEEGGWLVPLKFDSSVIEYMETHRDAVVFDLSHFGKIQVAGPDAAAFLHNLCTNDVKGLPLGAACEAFLTTAKAKTVAYVLVAHVLLPDEKQAFWLDVGPGRAEAVYKHLDHFLVSEQVELTDRTRDFAQFHLAGPKAKAVLDKVLGAPAPDLAELRHVARSFGAAAPSYIRRHDPLGEPGYDFVCPVGDATMLWEALTKAGARPGGREAYEMLRIEGGTPLFGADIDEDRFVVEVGRTERAICYTKGCYLGQEPIVMARDRGHVNRMLVGLKVIGAMPVPSGSKVFRDGAEVGQTTSATFNPLIGQLALAYVRRGNWDVGTALEVETEFSKRDAKVAPLPFKDDEPSSS